MNTFLHSLILVSILALSSPYGYDQFPGSLSVEARKLNSNGGSMIFTVDLIHRDSLLSPQERQKRLPFGSVSRGHPKNLSSVYYENKDVETDITLGGGDYLMKLAIGTPPFEFMAVADTGSDLIWLECSSCQPCIEQQSASFFDPTTSSTYQSIDCHSASCHYPDIRSGCAANDESSNGACTYAAKYGDATQSIGSLSTETITFPDSSVTLSPTVFGCGYAQTGSLSNGAGIIGLGAGSLSLVSQLGPNINYKFSYCLIPRSSGGSSKLKFGADLAATSGVVSTPFVTRSDIPDYYLLTLDNISIRGDSPIQVGQPIIIDSGSTLTSLETGVYNAVRDAVSAAIGLSSVSGPYGMDLCYEAPQESLNPPDVVFNFQGANVVLKAVNILWELQGMTCLAITPTSGTPIFGNIAQVNFEVGYDLQAKQVSFAPTDCTTY